VLTDYYIFEHICEWVSLGAFIAWHYSMTACRYQSDYSGFDLWISQRSASLCDKFAINLGFISFIRRDSAEFTTLFTPGTQSISIKYALKLLSLLLQLELSIKVAIKRLKRISKHVAFEDLKKKAETEDCRLKTED